MRPLSLVRWMAQLSPEQHWPSYYEPTTRVHDGSTLLQQVVQSRRATGLRYAPTFLPSIRFNRSLALANARPR